jgi:hypothetical protein
MLTSSNRHTRLIKNYYNVATDTWPFLQDSCLAAAAPGSATEDKFPPMRLPADLPRIPVTFDMLGFLSNKYIVLAGIPTASLNLMNIITLSKVRLYCIASSLPGAVFLAFLTCIFIYCCDPAHCHAQPSHQGP